MQKLGEHALNIAAQLGADYADLRIIEQERQTIVTKGQVVSELDSGTSLGIGIRVLVKGGWGFASTQQLSRSAIEAAVKRAFTVAKASACCVNPAIGLAPEPVYDATWVSPHLVDPFSVSLEEKIGILLEAAKIMNAVKGVTLTTGFMSFIRDEKLFMSSSGSRIKQTFIRSGCGIEAYAANADDQQRRSYPKSNGQHELAGWELILRLDLKKEAQRVAEEAVALLSADICPRTAATVVLEPSQLGLQVHESMGHPAELDRALGQEINFAGASFLTPDKLNKLQYGAGIVNLVADATTPGAIGSFAFDDEGVQAQNVHLVKDGTFTGYLSSRDTASLIGLERSGGMMRAESCHFAPIIRMTNISLLPGDAGSLEDIIADTEDGIYMATNYSWSIDQLRYNFQFSTEIGWEIKNGKRKRMLKNCSYGGITPQFWNSCDAIGGRQDYMLSGEPNCGKGQPMQTMWTGHGAPPARFRNVNVGIAHKG
ncbi:MAG: TldD/PmbA family protein [Candidatus Obscuribacterales bacterium]|nr:TldD/PmbA family protein [Candidatus Obscuribacterales bacterium]